MRLASAVTTDAIIAKYGFSIQGMISPIVCVLFVRKLFAIMLGVYPQRSASALIMATVSGLMRYFAACPFNAREMVDIENPVRCERLMSVLFSIGESFRLQR